MDIGTAAVVAMDVAKAIEIIRQVCAIHVGNLQDHTTIQQALKVVEGELAQLIETKKE